MVQNELKIRSVNKFQGHFAAALVSRGGVYRRHTPHAADESSPTHTLRTTIVLLQSFRPPEQGRNRQKTVDVPAREWLRGHLG